MINIRCVLAFFWCFITTVVAFLSRGYFPQSVPFIERKKAWYIMFVYGGKGVRECFRRPLTRGSNTVIDVTREAQKYDKLGDNIQDVEKKGVINFGSYNYLGYADFRLESFVEECQERGIKELTQGNVSPMAQEWQTDNRSEVVRTLEEKVAKFVGMEAAIVFPTGWGTNVSALPCLIDEKTLIISDEKNHASIALGCRFGNSQHKVRTFKFNDMRDLQRVLEQVHLEQEESLFSKELTKFSKILIVVEGIYSMEGELLDLRTLLVLKKRYGAYLYIDEAHSIGAIGSRGAGICDVYKVDPNEEVDILMGTFTKSFASIGGYVSGKREIIETIRSKVLKYESAISDVCAWQIIRTLDDLQSEDGKKRLKRITDNTQRMRKKLLEVIESERVLGQDESPVIPILTYDVLTMGRVSRQCLDKGVAIVVAAYPATAWNESRVRLCISAEHTFEQIDETCKILFEAMGYTK